MPLRSISGTVAGSIHRVKLDENKGRIIALDILDHLVCDFRVTSRALDYTEIILDDAKIYRVPVAEGSHIRIWESLFYNPEY